MQNHLAGFRVEDIVVVGGLQEADVFFDEKDVPIQDWMHERDLLCELREKKKPQDNECIENCK